MKFSAQLRSRVVLVVIDAQVDFAAPAGKMPVDASQAEGMFAALNPLLARAAAAGLEVVYIRTEWRNPITRWLNRGSVRRGTAGADFDPRLRRVPGPVFVKGSQDAFGARDFAAHLAAGKCDHLLVTGLAAEYCVCATVLSARKRGLRVTAVRDAIAADAAGGLEPALEKYRAVGAEVRFAAEVAGAG